jgi:hypothetical protein
MPENVPVNSPFEIVTSNKSKKIGTRSIIIVICIVVFLILGIVAGVVLVQQQQNISKKAQANLCPGAGACPVLGQPTILRNCNPGNSDGTPQEISCSNIGNVGQMSTCSTQRFCCPSLGASWTTDLTLCTVATPTPTPFATFTPIATATPSSTPIGLGSGALFATGSATPTPTASVSATPKALATPREIPVTGTGWPTMIGVGIGAAAIIAAILLAL